MRNFISIKIILSVALFLFTGIYARGQATLPFTYDSGRPVTTVTGLTQSGLGADYAASPKMKFDTSGDNLILNFAGVPGTLSFKIIWNQSSAVARFPGEFTLQESADGVTYTTVQSYNTTSGTALANGTAVTETFTTLLAASRYLKWVYTSKSNGNIGIGAISLAAGLSGIVNMSTNVLNGFAYTAGSGPSAEQSFTVSGSGLTTNISITPPTDYEISTGTGAAFVSTNPVTLAQSGGVVNNTGIYVRLKQGLVAGNYNENIGIASAGANSGIINCSGTVVANPTVTLTDVTDPILNTVQGSPVSQTINVSGVNLSADLGLSITGADAGLFKLSQYTVIQTGGAVPNTIVTITYTPTAIGSNSAILTMSSPIAMVVQRTLYGNSTIATSEINELKTSFIISVENGNVLFNASAGETVEIYNSIGQRLVQRLSVEGQNTIPVPIHGVVLVKVGNKVAKAIL